METKVWLDVLMKVWRSVEMVVVATEGSSKSKEEVVEGEIAETAAEMMSSSKNGVMVAIAVVGGALT